MAAKENIKVTLFCHLRLIFEHTGSNEHKKVFFTQ